MGSIEREGKPCGVGGALQGRSGDAEGDAAPSPTHFSPPFIIVKGRAAPKYGILGQNRKLWGEPGCASKPGQGTASWSPRAAGWQRWMSPTHPKSSTGRASGDRRMEILQKKKQEIFGGCSPPCEHPQTPKPSLTCARRPPQLLFHGPAVTVGFGHRRPRGAAAAAAPLLLFPQVGASGKDFGKPVINPSI